MEPIAAELEDDEAAQFLATTLAILGRPDEAARQGERALEQAVSSSRS